MDLQISRWIVDTFGSSKAVAIIARIFTYGGSSWFVLAVVALLLIFKKTRKMGVCALFAVGATFVLNDFILKPLIARDRPFITDPSLTKMCELSGLKLPDGYSMTSGHSAVTMALAVSIMIHSWKIGIPSMILSFLVGVSRIVLCVHYLTDVIAGFAFGTVMAVATYFAIILIKKLLEKRRKKKDENTSASVKQQTQN